jgi:mono/diheme cytochrome c family protein
MVVRASNSARLARIAAGLAMVTTVLVVLAVAVVYALSSRRLGRRHEVPAGDRVTIPTDSASIARGMRIATGFGACTLCHGDDFGGHVYADAGPLGIIAGPNLTTGRGGIAGARTDAELIRAIRYGVHPDGTSLIVMPSEVYVYLSDADLGALIAWLRTLPPVDRELPASRFRLLGRALLATGGLPLLTAEKTARPETVPAIEAGPTPEYGRYLTDVAGCTGCHGHGLSGGRVAGPPDLPLASNLTPAGAIARWSETDFRRALREGMRPGDVPIDSFMPFRQLGRMSDDEIHVIWLYLKTVPARDFGNK